jgi:hypothetical protein
VTAPATTSVLRTVNDWLVAPRASAGDLLVTYTGALAGSALAIAPAANAGLPTLALAVIAVVAFDQFGGAVANATAAAKRRFRGPANSRRHQLVFVADPHPAVRPGPGGPRLGMGRNRGHLRASAGGAVVVLAASRWCG